MLNVNDAVRDIRCPTAAHDSPSPLTPTSPLPDAPAPEPPPPGSLRADVESYISEYDLYYDCVLLYRRKLPVHVCLGSIAAPAHSLFNFVADPLALFEVPPASTLSDTNLRIISNSTNFLE